jgi:hypothetical protein
MSVKENTKILDLLNELSMNVKHFGIDRTTKLLNKNRISKINNLNEKVEFVIDSVCNKFNLSVENVFKGNSRKDFRADAIGMIAFFLHKDFEYKISIIAIIFQKSIPAISIYRKRIELLSDKIPHHRHLIDIKEKVESEIQLFKKINKE